MNVFKGWQLKLKKTYVNNILMTARLKRKGELL